MTTSPLDESRDHLLEYRAQLLARLETQPGEFAAAVAALPEAAWRQPWDRLGRSPHAIAAHVRDLEVLAFLPRVRRILEEDGALLEAFASHHWSAEHYDPAEPMAAVLQAWSQARTELVHRLPGAPDAAWSRTGFHPPSGSRTLQWWVERAYTHAREHLETIGAAH